MPKKFRLAALLKVRRLIEERKMEEFGRAVTALTRATAAQSEAEADFAGEQDAYNDAAAANAPIDELRLRESHLQVARDLVRRLELAAAAARRALEAKREELLAAQRDREVVEALHEKFRSRAAYEANQQAEKQLAETAINRFLRRRLETEREVS
jgi:flagellar export protein FliJ